jgi:hypothetical protein
MIAAFLSDLQFNSNFQVIAQKGKEGFLRHHPRSGIAVEISLQLESEND